MNNSSGCCKQIEELIEEYKNKLKCIEACDYGEREVLYDVIEDLERILYE